LSIYLLGYFSPNTLHDLLPVINLERRLDRRCQLQELAQGSDVVLWELVLEECQHLVNESAERELVLLQAFDLLVEVL